MPDSIPIPAKHCTDRSCTGKHERAGIYGVIRDTVGVERTTAELHEVALGYLAQIRLAVASVQRSAFTKVQILETDMGKAAVNLDVAVEDAVSP